MKKQFAVISSSLLIAISTISCSQEPSLEDASNQVCQNLAQLQQDIASLNAVSANSTVGDLKGAQQAIADSFADVKSSVAQVQEIRIAELEQAYTDVENAVNSISDRDTIGDAINSVQAEVEELEAARNKLFSSINCQ